MASGTAHAIAIGTADGTYDFGVISRVNDSGGVGYKTQGDKFVVDNAMLQDPALPSIYYNSDLPGTVLFSIKSERTNSVMTQFTYSDLRISAYTQTNLSGLVVTFRDYFGRQLSQHTLTAPINVDPYIPLWLSAMSMTPAVPASINNVAQIDFTMTVASPVWNMMLDLITMANITNVVPVNNPPVFSATPAISQASAVVGDTLTLANTATTDADGDTVTLSYQWTANGVNIVGATAATYTLTSNEAHKAITCAVTANDGLGQPNSTVSVTTTGVTLTNSLPSFTGTPAIAQAAPTIGTTLTMNNTATSDADGDTVILSYQWYANGNPVAGATGANYTPSVAYAHAPISCSISGSDGNGGTLGPVTTASVTMANSQPTFTGTPAIGGTAAIGNTLSLTGTATSDVDGDTVALGYQWQANGVNIVGATAATYTLTVAEAHKSITCVVTGNDGSGAINATVSATTAGVTMANAQPAFTGTPAVSGTAAVGNTLSLTGTATSDVDGDTVALGYQWQANGVNIVGATAATYTLTVAEAHKSITCVVTGNDGSGAINATVSATTAGVAMVNSAPTIQASYNNGLILMNNTSGTLIVNGNDADGDTLIYSISTPTLGTASFAGNVLTYNSTAVGSEQVTVSVDDGNGGTISRSVTVTVNDPVGAGNNAPAPSGTGLTIGQSNSIGLNPNAATTDHDGDGISDAQEVGDPANPTDSDGDGIFDVFEASGKASDASIATGLMVASGSVEISSPGESISSVTYTASGANAPAGVNFPYGLIGYNTTAPTGASKVVTLTFTAALPATFTIYKVDATGNYTALPTASWTQVDANTVTVTLTDGDPATDLDGVANGVIVDPLSIGATAATTTMGGGGGCTINAQAGNGDATLVLLALLALISLRRSGQMRR